MAFKRTLAVAAIIATVLRTIAVPANYAVGDEKGWDTGVNYTDWSEGKEFRVGDTLVFKYIRGDHNVIEVGETEFEECNVSTTARVRTSGFDAITLTTAGEMRYLCGKKNHCLLGQKLAVTVLPSITVAESPHSPPLASGSSKRRITACKYPLLMVVVAAMIML